MLNPPQYLEYIKSSVRQKKRKYRKSTCSNHGDYSGFVPRIVKSLLFLSLKYQIKSGVRQKNSIELQEFVFRLSAPDGAKSSSSPK